jgi:hypothetical protein
MCWEPVLSTSVHRYPTSPQTEAALRTLSPPARWAAAMGAQVSRAVRGQGPSSPELMSVVADTGPRSCSEVTTTTPVTTRSKNESRDLVLAIEFVFSLPRDSMSDHDVFTSLKKFLAPLTGDGLLLQQ